MVKKIETTETNEIKELKEELTTYIDKQLKKNWTEEIDKANRRLVREKNRKILIRNILIILLLGVIGYLVYVLYDINYFDKYFQHEEPTKQTTDNGNTKRDDTEEEKEPTLEELVAEYGSLIDNITISEESSYIEDYYYGKLSTELKNYLALNNVDFSKIEVEDDCNIIDEDTIVSAFYELFVDDYVSNGFDYNGNKVKYLNKLESYITDSLLEKTTSNIKREIIDIKVTDTEVVITTIEGVVKNNKLYNIVTDKEVKNYKNDSLTKYEDKLNEVVYTFKDKKLVSLG